MPYPLSCPLRPAALLQSKYIYPSVCLYLIVLLIGSHWMRFNNGEASIKKLAVATPRPPRILCWILCDVSNLWSRVRYIRDTWGQRCDITLYMSSRPNASFPAVGLNVSQGRNHIALKARKAWQYIYERHLGDADYFLKADPDTYVLVENLRSFLTGRDSQSPEFFGHWYYIHKNKIPIYLSGGPGEVLSQEALRRLVERAFQRKPDCMKDGQFEDLKVSTCLQKVGVRPVFTHDRAGRERFIVFDLATLLDASARLPDWYRSRDPALLGDACCSDRPISFHYVPAARMKMLDYLLYKVKLS